MDKKIRSMVLQYMQYYTEVTGRTVDDFFDDILKVTDRPQSQQWLAHKIVETLSARGISKETLFEFRDIIHRYDKDISETEGEFYTPLVWAKEAHKYIKDLCGDDWGTVNIWDASCGTGNLLVELDYPKDRLFCSTLNDEDIPIVKSRMPDVTSFKLDFLNEIDYDSQNEYFSEQLPENLKEKLRNGESFLFFMNPPYSRASSSTDVGEVMRQEKLPRSNEAFVQFYKRIDMIVEYYGLKNVYIAFLHPLVGYQYLTDKTKQYQFVKGFCFDRKEFKGTANFSRTWYVGLFMWKSSSSPEYLSSLPFTRKEIRDDVICDVDTIFVGNYNDVRSQLRGNTSLSDYKFLPDCNGTTINPAKAIRVKKDALGFFSNPFVDGYATATSSWFDTLPYSRQYPITPEQFYTFVPYVLLAVLRASSMQSNSFALCSPDESKEGYRQWLTDNLPLFMFSRRSRFRAVRGINFGGTMLNVGNTMFPLAKSSVRKLISDGVITDEVIIKDVNSSKVCNDFIVQEIQKNYDSFSKEAKAFFDFCMVNIIESLRGTVRAENKYAGDTECWDAGIYQVRKLSTLWTPDKDREYFELQNDLVESLSDGVYDFGFVDAGWKNN